MKIALPRLLGVLVFTLAGMSLLMFADTVVATVPVGQDPYYAAVNTVTNKIYVANELCNTFPCTSPGTVSVIDGATNTVTATINAGISPGPIAVNSVTNKIYVANTCGSDPTCQSPGTVTVIDGATLATRTVTVGYVPAAVAINSATNQVYVANECIGSGYPSNCVECGTGLVGTLTVIDGGTLNTQSVPLGCSPLGVVVNAATNTIYTVSGANNLGGNPDNGLVTVINGSNFSTQTVLTGLLSRSIAIDAPTNKIYVTNQCGNDPDCQSGGTVTVVDGATLATQSVTVAFDPILVAVNPIAEKIYIGNQCGDLSCDTTPIVTVIDGTTLATTALSVCSVGDPPVDLEVNAATNKIYYPCDSSAGTVTVIDGASNSMSTVAVGDQPTAAGINSVTNTIYVPNFADATVSVLSGASLQLVSVTPCRLVDTRQTGAPIQGGTAQSFTLPTLGGCGISPNAAAYSLNVTVVPHEPLGYLTVWPTGENQPVVSTMNSLDGRTKANAAIVPAGTNGAVSVFASNTTDLVLDIDGYFAPAGTQTFEFYPLTPCRVIDTRGADGDLGGPSLAGGVERDFLVLESSCIPSGANPQAYSFNVTVVPNPTSQPLGYLTVWPEGEAQPTVSTLNNPTATDVANAAIVPAGSNGAIAVFPSNSTDLVVDINGYFAAPGPAGLQLYPVTPCRVLDTRGVGSGNPITGEYTVNVAGSTCAPPSSAQGYVFNATVVPSGALGYLSLWPDGLGQPVVSTLNALDGAVSSNMAIVPTQNSSIDAYVSNLTQLLLDISSYFAP